ncbi:MAG: Uncharacterised protein [Flavobacteriia bacterium]|nr:MAG: Uncharacterised protein [Flavobacteriia bacterium]
MVQVVFVLGKDDRAGKWRPKHFVRIETERVDLLQPANQVLVPFAEYHGTAVGAVDVQPHIEFIAQAAHGGNGIECAEDRCASGEVHHDGNEPFFQVFLNHPLQLLWIYSSLFIRRDVANIVFTDAGEGGILGDAVMRFVGGVDGHGFVGPIMAYVPIRSVTCHDHRH